MQRLRAQFSEKSTLQQFKYMANHFGNARYLELVMRKRSASAWWRMGVWGLRVVRGDVEGGECALCGSAVSAEHLLLSCPALAKERDNYLADHLDRRTTRRDNMIRLAQSERRKVQEDIGEFLCKCKNKWEAAVLGDTMS